MTIFFFLKFSFFAFWMYNFLPLWIFFLSINFIFLPTHQEPWPQLSTYFNIYLLNCKSYTPMMLNTIWIYLHDSKISILSPDFLGFNSSFPVAILIFVCAHITFMCKYLCLRRSTQGLLKVASFCCLSRNSKYCHVLNMQMCNLKAILIPSPKESIGCSEVLLLVSPLSPP